MVLWGLLTTETQRTQRLHREDRKVGHYLGESSSMRFKVKDILFDGKLEY
jgi:hypothetical protein